MIEKLQKGLYRREAFFSAAATDKTNCYRLLHGATEGLPGISIDRYGSIIVFQTWRNELCNEELSQLRAVIQKHFQEEFHFVWNHRQKRGQVQHHPVTSLPESPIGFELGLQYDVRPIHQGIDPLLFLDFRAGRRWIKAHAQGKEILNLFAYTCGIGVAACAGGAKWVQNVDFSQRSLQIGRFNAHKNDFTPAQFQCIQDDVFPVIRQYSGLGIKGRAAKRGFQKRVPQQFDIVVLDPPRMSKSPFGKVDLVHDYPALLKPSLLCLKSNGWIMCTNNVASVEETLWHKQIQRCAHKIRKNIMRLIPLRPELDFPSPDQKWPLKIALCQVE